MNDSPFQRVVLLNLDRRPDRLAAAYQQLGAANWPFRWPERFRAVDGRTVPCPRGFTEGGPAWGCLQSHRRILEQAILDGIGCLLVLEDDLVLRPGFAAAVAAFLAAVPADWDGLMLGGQHHQMPLPFAPGVVKCLNCQRTHAYAVRGRFLRDLYQAWCDPRVTVHCDWVSGPMHAHYRVFAPDPFLVGQGRGHSDITCRQNPTKFWQPPTGAEPVVVLRAPPQVLPDLRRAGWHTGYTREPATDFDVGLVQVVRGAKRLTDWIGELQWEVVSEDGWILCIWHPAVTIAQVQAAWQGPVYEVCAATAAEALDRLAAQRGGLSRGA